MKSILFSLSKWHVLMYLSFSVISASSLTHTSYSSLCKLSTVYTVALFHQREYIVSLLVDAWKHIKYQLYMYTFLLPILNCRFSNFSVYDSSSVQKLLFINNLICKQKHLENCAFVCRLNRMTNTTRTNTTVAIFPMQTQTQTRMWPQFPKL